MRIPNQYMGLKRNACPYWGALRLINEVSVSVTSFPSAIPVGIHGGYIVFDDDGSVYYCEPRFSDGFYDCRSLGGSTGPIPPPPNPCVHYKTDTKCVLIWMYCNDRCRYADGTESSSGWYNCGICTPELSLLSQSYSRNHLEKPIAI